MGFARSFLLTGLLVTPLLVSTATQAQAAAACARVGSDFNGDGRADLAVSAPYRDENFGGVNVLYGAASGLSTSAAQYFTNKSKGIPRNRNVGGSDRFGESLASGYLDGDCYADLAISAASSSSLVVLYGSVAGLSTQRSQIFDRSDIQPDGEYGSLFGADLAAADFNGDGVDDLAAGAYSTDDNAGAVGVLYGTPTGLTATGSAWIDQDTAGVPGTAEPGDTFGWHLAAGDFDGDGRADLAAAASRETLGSAYDAGGVVILRGSAGGLSGTGAQWFDQNSPGVPGTAEANDTFGEALTAGDVTGDGRADLIVGVPGEGVGSTQAAGLVTVLPGSATGLTATGAVSWDQSNAQIPGEAESNDRFGAALAIVDHNHDGRPDLAIGSPGESIGATYGSGSVTVLYGATTAGAAFIDQNSPGVPGSNEAEDYFGSALKNVAGALVVGAPGESAGATRDGAFTILPAGVFVQGSQLPGGAADNGSLGYSFG